MSSVNRLKMTYQNQVYYPITSNTLATERDHEAISIGWQYLSNATCLIWYRLLYAVFVVSRTIIISYIIRHLLRTPVLDK